MVDLSKPINKEEQGIIIESLMKAGLLSKKIKTRRWGKSKMIRVERAIKYAIRKSKEITVLTGLSSENKRREK